MAKSRVVVVGGGFAGINAVNTLARQGHDVTLIDQRPYTTFLPLLYQVATGGLNAGDMTFPLRRLVANLRKHHARFHRAQVIGIDTDAKQVICAEGAPVEYDYLVLAAGAGVTYFGTPGAEEHAKHIYNRAAALDVRNTVFTGLENLSTDGDPNKTFTAVVVGGGPTGVEMAGTLADLKMQALPTLYPDVPVDNFKVMLFEMIGNLLNPFEKSSQEYALRQLDKRGVDIRLNTAISEIGEDHITLKDGQKIEADIVIWSAGVGAHAIVKEWGMPQGRGGRILTEPDLRVQGHDDIFAIGDCAMIESDPLPQLARPALSEGKHVALQIDALLDGRPTQPFHYHNPGTAAYIGRYAAVVELPQRGKLPAMKFTGFIAWVMWMALHIAMLRGVNRVQSLMNLGVRFVNWPKSATAVIGDVREPEEVTESLHKKKHVDPEGGAEPETSKKQADKA